VATLGFAGSTNSPFVIIDNDCSEAVAGSFGGYCLDG